MKKALLVVPAAFALSGCVTGLAAVKEGMSCENAFKARETMSKVRTAIETAERVIDRVCPIARD